MRCFHLAFYFLAYLSASQLYAQNPYVLTGKAPAWVAPVSFNPRATPTAGQEAGFYCLLIDGQENIATAESFAHVAYKILTTEGVQTMSDLTISFDPTYQTVKLHWIRIHRADQVIDKTPAAPIRTIQREQSMDRYLYDGSLTTVINMTDVRVGDIVEYAFTRKGYNPTYEGHVGTRINFSYNFACDKIFQRLIVPPSLSLNLDYRNTDIKPEITSTAAGIEYVWSRKHIDAFLPDTNVPDWYDGNQYVMASSINNWSEVASWAARQFRVPEAERQALKERIGNIFDADAKTTFALNAIRFVQDEIRYLGFESGLNSHKPHSPLKVFDQRFGDCKDKSLLLCSILKTADIEANPVLVNTVLRDKIENNKPSMTAFDHCVVQIKLDNSVYYIDPTISNQGGTLGNIAFPPYGKGLVIDEGTTALEQLFSHAMSDITETQTIAIPDFDGEAYLQVRTTYTGADADYIRGEFLNTNAESIQKNYLTFYGNLFPDIEVLSPVTHHDKRRENIFTLEENYRIPAFWQVSPTDPDLVYSEVYPQSLQNYFDISKSSQRTTPYRLQYPVSYHHSFKIKLPEAWNVELDERYIDNDYYHYEYYVRHAGNDITVETHYSTKQDHVPLDAFSQFVSDHGEMFSNLSFQLSYNKKLVGNEKGISWLGIITGLVALGFGLWMALWLYYHYDPAPAVRVWNGGEPIGGWLVVVAIGLVLSPFRMVYDLFNLPEVYDSQMWANLSALKRYDLFAFILFTHIYNIVFLSYMILILVLFFKRRSSLPKLVTIYFAVNCFVTVTDSLIGSALDSSMASNPEYYRNMFSSVVAAAIWIPYFNMSSRVKETFVVRIGDDDDDEAALAYSSADEYESKGDYPAPLN